MKINRRNPLHWLWLLAFAANVAIAVLLRPLFHRRRRRGRVLFYGHRLAGNLLPIQRAIAAQRSDDLKASFLTMDPAYFRELRRRGEDCLLAISPRCIPSLVRADALVSDHGLHALLPLLLASDLKFFDVWHGIPFKGFDADDFRVQRRYDEVWVPSPFLRELYVERFGFLPSKVWSTGYARTDAMVRPAEAPASIRARLGLPPAGKIVVYAPTWKQDAPSRSLFPFGMSGSDFLQRLVASTRRQNATLVLRTHLNSGLKDALTGSGTVVLPYATHPDTESLLFVADMLLCDWSSIAFDYLLLDRPTIFIDVPPPFAKGFSLGPSYRFGAVVKDMPTLEGAVERFLSRPWDYHNLHGEHAAKLRNQLYGGLADGDATQRCVERLLLALG